jgi:hypothetical protein
MKMEDVTSLLDRNIDQNHHIHQDNFKIVREDKHC